MNSNLAEAFKAKGLVYFASNNIDLAELNNDKALEINPNFMAAVDSRINLMAEIQANKPSIWKRIFGG